MNTRGELADKRKQLDFFERYISVWVLLCMVAGIGLGKLLPDVTARISSKSMFNSWSPERNERSGRDMLMLWPLAFVILMLGDMIISSVIFCVSDRSDHLGISRSSRH